MNVLNNDNYLFYSETPLEWLKPLGDQDIMESQTAILETEVNLPNKEGKWLKNGKPVKAGGRFEIIMDGCIHSLVISDAQLDDEAEYTLVIGDKQTTGTLFVEGWFSVWS